MDKKTFDSYMKASERSEAKYKAGYRHGLTDHFEGINKEASARVSSLFENKEVADGYSDGFDGKPPVGAHGSLGNKNAAKDKTLDAVMTLRLSSELKGLCNARAQKEGMKLGKWAIKAMEAALK